MRTNGESKFRYLLVGLGLGAIGGLMAALLARKKTRNLLRERSTEALGYLSQQGKKLCDTTGGIVKKGTELMSHRCCSVAATSEAHQEERQETLSS